MTYRDQLEFKIRKLTRAIDALSDLSADLNLTAGVVETLGKLRQKRADIRRAIATGRRSCGECGNPMRHETMHTANDVMTARLARMGESSYHVCEERVCSGSGTMIFK